MVVALILVGTSLRGLTTSVHVVGATQCSRAEALYRHALGASAGQRPTDVIVVSSKGCLRVRLVHDVDEESRVPEWAEDRRERPAVHARGHGQTVPVPLRGQRAIEILEQAVR